ncbi:MAG: chemotaxis protein CheB [Gammaproteobacteria bacterium]
MILQEPPIASKSCSSNPEDLSNARIAIVSDSFKHRQDLQKVLEHAGLRIVANEPTSRGFLEKLDYFQADVILLDIDEASDKQQDFITELLDKTSTPIIFNDITVLSLQEPESRGKWYSKLLSKIADITGKLDWDVLDLDLGSSVFVTNALERPARASIDLNLAKNIWILGASLGGPDAIKKFLSLIPADLPVAFILAQHLGENFVSRLAKQLDRVTAFKVFTSHTGHVLRHGEVLVTPVDYRLKINPIGAVELFPLTIDSAYSPSIDLVMQDFAERYKEPVNAIVFSGMCDDGATGAAAITEHGGEVWVQSPESCVVSSMPENVNKKTKVSFSASPEMLAKQLIERYQSEL